MSMTPVSFRTMAVINTSRFTFLIFTILALKIVRSVNNITDTILAVIIVSTVRSNTLIVTTLVTSLTVRVSITPTPVRLSTSSTNRFVHGTFAIIWTTWCADTWLRLSITPCAGVVRPGLVTHIRGTVIIGVTTTRIICAVYITGPVTHWAHRILVLRVKTKSLLFLAPSYLSPTMSTFKQTGFITWSAFPESAAV